jgi:hypothetical protein
MTCRTPLKLLGKVGPLEQIQYSLVNPLKKLTNVNDRLELAQNWADAALALRNFSAPKGYNNRRRAGIYRAGLGRGHLGFLELLVQTE